MSLSVERQFVDGAWRTVVRDELGGPQVAAYANSINVADGTTESVPLIFWGIGEEGLLDLSDPASPVALATGIYTVSVTMTASGLTDGGLATCSPFFGGTLGNGFGREIVVVRPENLSGGGSWTGVLTEGDVLNVDVFNNDGAAARDFSVRMVIAFWPAAVPIA